MGMLSDESLALLFELVEATRRQPAGQRHPFVMAAVVGSSNYRVIHPGLPDDYAGAYPGDVDVLVRSGLLIHRWNNRTLSIDVAPEGFSAYADRHQAVSSPVATIEAEMRALLDSDTFRGAHKGSLAKWSEAEALLWKADANDQLTTIGHLCRETMQLFAAELVERFKPTNPPADPTATVARMRCVLEATLSSSAKTAFFKSLLAYWGSVSDLVQRQEHGALKEGEALEWDDARRVVFQTMNVMYEVRSHVNSAN
jgi:hypothetical protein